MIDSTVNPSRSSSQHLAKPLLPSGNMTIRRAASAAPYCSIIPNAPVGFHLSSRLQTRVASIMSSCSSRSSSDVMAKPPNWKGNSGQLLDPAAHTRDVFRVSSNWKRGAGSRYPFSRTIHFTPRGVRRSTPIVPRPCASPSRACAAGSLSCKATVSRSCAFKLGRFLSRTSRMVTLARTASTSSQSFDGVFHRPGSLPASTSHGSTEPVRSSSSKLALVSSMPPMKGSSPAGGQGVRLCSWFLDGDEKPKTKSDLAPRSSGKENHLKNVKPFIETLRVTNPVRQSRASSRKRVLRGGG